MYRLQSQSLKKWPNPSPHIEPVIGARYIRATAVSLNRYGGGLMNWVMVAVMPMAHIIMIMTYMAAIF
jgi:hypothetical protein